MKTFTILAVSALAAVALTGADFADAKRLGGGRSLGTQRQQIAPPPAAAPAPTAPTGAASNPVMPANPATAAARTAAPAAGAAAASGASRWLGPIAGIAAGLGLAALMSHLGIAEEFASFLLIALLAVGVVFLVRMFLARRASPQPAMSGASYRSPGAWSPGNDAATRVEPTWGGGAASATAASRAFPPGFDPAPFAQQAKVQFKRLQEAYDKADREALADVMTPEMLAEVSRDLDQRGAHMPTDVVALDAEVVEVVQEGRNYVASVRFTGALREDGASQAKPFVEVWNLVKPVSGKSGWLLAGIQQGEESLASR